MKKLLLVVAILVLLGIGAFAWLNLRGPKSSGTPAPDYGAAGRNIVTWYANHPLGGGWHVISTSQNGQVLMIHVTSDDPAPQDQARSLLCPGPLQLAQGARLQFTVVSPSGVDAFSCG